MWCSAAERLPVAARLALLESAVERMSVALSLGVATDGQPEHQIFANALARRSKPGSLSETLCEPVPAAEALQAELREAALAQSGRAQPGSAQPGSAVTASGQSSSGTSAKMRVVVHELLSADPAKRQLEDELARERALFAAAVDQIPLCVVTADAHTGHVRKVNKYTETLLGLTGPVDVPDVAAYRLWGFRKMDGSPILPHEYPLARAAVHRETISGELSKMTRADGQERIMRLWAAPVCDPSGMQIAAIVFGADVTDELRAAEAAARLIAAEHTAAAVSQLMANVSHELRSPLHGILGMAELLASMQLSPEQAECVAAITDSGKLLLVVINDLLDHEKMRAGALQLERVPFQLRTVLNHGVALMSEVARRKGVTLRLLLDADVPQGCALVGDPHRLEQILMNLLSNSVRFTPPAGTVDVIVRADPQDDGPAAPVCQFGSCMPPLDATGAAGAALVCPAVVKLTLQVRDTGIGIDAATLPRLFQPYTQADSSHSRRFGGTGLGLAICKQITTLMGGSIVAASEGEGRGTTMTMTVTMPTCHVQQRPATCEDAAAAASARANEGAVAGASNQAPSDITPRSCAGADSAARVATLTTPLPAVTQSPAHIARDDDASGTAANHALAAAAQAAGIIGAATAAPEEVNSGVVPAGGAGVVAPGEHAPGPVAGAASRPPPPLLVVDDNRVNARLAQKLLSRAGYTDVTVAEDGQQAVDAVLARPTPFAAILMDCQMPVMDGYEATRRLRALPDATKARVPVVALTASALRADVERSAAAGMDDHLPKPFDAAGLAAKVAHWVRIGVERHRAVAVAAPAPAAPACSGSGTNGSATRQAGES